jgi:hypothetical protein
MALLAVILITCICTGEMVAVQPSEDVYVTSYGTGFMFARSILKYDISSVPGSRVIDSVFLTVTSYAARGSWDGDMIFYNFNSQTWNESSTAMDLRDVPQTDSTLQQTGFTMSSGPGSGTVKSIDLKATFNRDYSAGNTYTSIMLTDPDNIAPVMFIAGVADIDSSIVVGTFTGLEPSDLRFLPREFSPNTMPWLLIYHSAPVSVFNHGSKADIPAEGRIYPNPFRNQTVISTGIPGVNHKLNIYDSRGRLVRTLANRNAGGTLWNGLDNNGNRIPAGMYFLGVQGHEQVKLKKVIKTN